MAASSTKPTPCSAEAPYASVLIIVIRPADIGRAVLVPPLFANGDIIRGPTMFGVAGEAGDEAIMPLTRVGGKLGVATTGGGGDNFNITIQAIDTQTGAEFLRKNMPQIVGGLRGSNNLNRGVGRVR